MFGDQKHFSRSEEAIQVILEHLGLLCRHLLTTFTISFTTILDISWLLHPYLCQFISDFLPFERKKALVRVTWPLKRRRFCVLILRAFTPQSEFGHPKERMLKIFLVLGAIWSPNLALCPGDCLCDNTRLFSCLKIFCHWIL